MEVSRSTDLVQTLQNEMETLSPGLNINSPIVTSSLDNSNLNTAVIKYANNLQQISSIISQPQNRPVNNNMWCNGISLTSGANTMFFSGNGIQINQIDDRFRFLFDLVKIAVELKKEIILPASRSKKQKALVKKKDMLTRKGRSSEDSDDDIMTSSFDGDTPAFNCDLRGLNSNLFDYIFSKIREFENKCNFFCNIKGFIIYLFFIIL